MVSPEMIRRYTYFAGLTSEQIVRLATVADEQEVAAGHYFFREGDMLDSFYIVLEGQVVTVIELIAKGKTSAIAELTEREREVTISTIGRGEAFAWSALIPPYTASITVRALSDCRLLAFNCVDLRQQFETDPSFGYLLTQRAAQGLRDRLRDLRIEALTLAAM